MFHAPQQINSITHPHIAAAFIKKDALKNNVLVLEVFKENTLNNDDDLMDIYMHLEDFKNKIEPSMGTLDRIDIRTH